jgi:WD40 repeat protein
MAVKWTRIRGAAGVAHEDWRHGMGGKRIAVCAVALGLVACLGSELRSLAEGAGVPTVVRTLTANSEVTSIAFSPDGRFLAVGDYNNNTVQVFDTSTGALLRALPRGAEHYVNIWVAFSGNGSVLADLGTDGELRMWDTATWSRSPFSVSGSGMTFAAFARDGTKIATATESRTGGRVRLWDFSTSEFLMLFTDLSGYPSALALSPDGTLLAAAGWALDGPQPGACVWSALTGELFYRTETPTNSITSLAFSPDGTLLALEQWDKTVQLRDATSGTLVRTLAGTGRHVASISFSADGKYLAAGDSSIDVWDIATGALLWTPAQYEDGSGHVAFSPAGALLAEGGGDTNQIRLWDVRGLRPASFEITASAGANGTVSPSVTVSVNAGDSQTFLFAPNASYHVADVIVDGQSVGAVPDYTFTNVTAAHSLGVTFASDAPAGPSSFIIIASAGPHGTISPNGGVSVPRGVAQSFTITPDAAYQIADVVVDGQSLGPLPAFTFSSVSASHTIRATFSPAAGREASPSRHAVTPGPSLLAVMQAVGAECTTETCSFLTRRVPAVSAGGGVRGVPYTLGDVVMAEFGLVLVLGGVQSTAVSIPLTMDVLRVSGEGAAESLSPVQEVAVAFDFATSLYTATVKTVDLGTGLFELKLVEANGDVVATLRIGVT